MNTTRTFPSGSHLARLGDLIRGVNQTMKPQDFIPDAYSAPAAATAHLDPQASPFVHRGNLETARFALNNIRPELMADFLADYLAARCGKVKASLILRDAANIVEGGK